MSTIEEKKHKADYMREYTRRNSEKINTQRRARAALNPARNKAQCKTWRGNNKSLKSQLDKEYQIKNKEKIALNKKRYYEKNRSHLIEVNCARTSYMRKTDMLYRLKSILRSSATGWVAIQVAATAITVVAPDAD